MSLASRLEQAFELSRGGDASANLRPMEGLRGVAVLLVFLVHYFSLLDPWLAEGSARAWSDGLRAVGHAGVDLFFVLSGYLIYGSLMQRAQPFGRFMRRRVVRIYPTFLVVFATYLLLMQVFPAERKGPAGEGDFVVWVAQNLALLPGVFPVEALVTVAWSLSYEMFFYLLVPVVLALLRLRDWPSGARQALFAAAALAVFVYCALFAGPVRMTMFLVGMLVWELLRHAPGRAPGAGVALAAALVATAAHAIPTQGSLGFTLKIAALAIGTGALCWTCFERPQVWLSRALCLTPLRWLGNMSYSYYLLHGLALKAGFLVFSKLSPPTGEAGWALWLGLFLPMLLLTLIASAVLFLLIERPMSLNTGRDAFWARPMRRQDSR